MGWFFGLKVHLVINDCGEILACQITPGNVDDRNPVSTLCKRLFGKLMADRGYISRLYLRNCWKPSMFSSLHVLRKI
jgi:hypothetical protein